MILDGIGQRYHVRPSELVGIDEPLIALDFDAAVMFRGKMLEQKFLESGQSEEAQQNQTTGFAAVKTMQARVMAASGGEDV